MTSYTHTSRLHPFVKPAKFRRSVSAYRSHTPSNLTWNKQTRNRVVNHYEYFSELSRLQVHPPLGIHSSTSMSTSFDKVCSSSSNASPGSEAQDMLVRMRARLWSGPVEPRRQNGCSALVECSVDSRATLVAHQPGGRLCGSVS